MLQRASDYESLRAGFAWGIPARYNIGSDVLDRHADGTGRLALVHERADGAVEHHDFDTLKARSNRLANALEGLGLAGGERLAILLPQAPETALAHATAYRMGAIALPLFTQFGPDALAYRLNDSGARAVITDTANVEKVLDLRANLPALEHVIVTGETAPPGAHALEALLAAADEGWTPVDTAAEDPALIIYTSGTTGQPKGALHAHRSLLGHLPGVELPQDFFPQPGDFFWTPADWAWIGGLMDVLLPAWHHGVAVLSRTPRRFDPEDAFATLARHRVRNLFLPPTALRMMRQVPDARARFDHDVRSIGSGGETLGTELLDWGRETFGLTINEFYGQTECNLIVANCGVLMDVRPGSMGRAVPGHEIGVVDENGRAVADGEMGQIAVRHPDPVMFLGYWGRPEATAAKFAGDWLLTGDLGRRDADGYFRFAGRDDDLITSSGYRIGPAEIEDCLLRHPAVALAAVIGVPDPVRTEIVKAFIVPAAGTEPGDRLAEEIRRFAAERLAAYEAPRVVEFVDELPVTATGKIMRRRLRPDAAS
jgi:acetyl-CoA synthetase